MFYVCLLCVFMDVNYLLEVQWNWNGNQTKYAG